MLFSPLSSFAAPVLWERQKWRKLVQMNDVRKNIPRELGILAPVYFFITFLEKNGELMAEIDEWPSDLTNVVWTLDWGGVEDLFDRRESPLYDKLLFVCRFNPTLWSSSQVGAHTMAVGIGSRHLQHYFNCLHMYVRNNSILWRYVRTSLYASCNLQY